MSSDTPAAPAGSSGGSKSSASATKRLLRELRDVERDPNPALTQLGPVSDEELFKWQATLLGPEGTAYEGGLFRLSILIPSTYPLSPPTITFVTPICHPNVQFKTGEICLDLLKTNWTGAYTLSSTLTSIQQLLTSAEPDSPLNVDAAALLRDGDLIAEESLVRYYTYSEAQA